MPFDTAAVKTDSFFLLKLYSYLFSNVEKILCMWKLCLPGLLETIT